MSRFAQRVAQDLGQIADRATPSSTAFDSIQTRIAEQTDEPDMEVIMLTPKDNEVSERTWVKPGLIVAAAAAILIVVGIVAFNSSDDDNDAAVAAQDPTEEALAVRTAVSFVEARDAGDGEAVRSLVADDAELDGEIVSTADEYPAVAEFNQATGWRFTEPDCTTTVVGPPAEVTCTYVMENAWSQALGVGPFTGSSYQFVIADGQIQQVTHNLDTSEHAWGGWDVFMDWLNDTHPDDVDTMIDPTEGRGDLPRATPEANALWEQHTTEFVAVRTAVSFVEARDAGDGEAVRSLVADDAELYGEIVSTADEYPAVAEFNQATGWRFKEPDCATTVVGPPAEVTCTYVMENAWSQALGVGPFYGSSYQFVIADSQIQQVTHNLDTILFGSLVWDVFMDWLNDTYPDDVDTMFDPTDDGDLPQATPEANALWEQHTTEFVSSQRDS